jgi:hypothetical protein
MTMAIWPPTAERAVGLGMDVGENGSGRRKKKRKKKNFDRRICSLLSILYCTVHRKRESFSFLPVQRQMGRACICYVVDTGFPVEGANDPRVTSSIKWGRRLKRKKKKKIWLEIRPFLH